MKKTSCSGPKIQCEHREDFRKTESKNKKCYAKVNKCHKMKIESILLNKCNWYIGNSSVWYRVLPLQTPFVSGPVLAAFQRNLILPSSSLFCIIIIMWICLWFLLILIQSHFRDFNKVWRTTKAVLAPKAMQSKWSGKPKHSKVASCPSPFFAGRNIVPNNYPSEFKSHSGSVLCLKAHSTSCFICCIIRREKIQQ